MILEMKVPSPGESITEVEIADWLVQDGDYVEKDQAIAEVDSDKEKPKFYLLKIYCLSSQSLVFIFHQYQVS